MKAIESLRLKLHNNAELSGCEVKTNKIINSFLEKTFPDIHYKNVGGYSIVAVYKGKNEGKNILLRADIDALNIPEEDRLYSHRCGHDGHAAILCGLAKSFAKSRPEKGDLILLFQAAEETGEGAKSVIDNGVLNDFKIDAAFALHNIPSFARHQIILKEDCFASASQGLKLIFDGASSHASQADKANNPQIVIMTLLDAFNKKYENLKKDKYKTTLTVTHVAIGEPSFGICPGHGEIWLTLRSQNDDSLNHLTQSTINLSEYLAREFKLSFSYEILEAFPSTMNSSELCSLTERAAKELSLSVNKMKEPFPWSEDFGRLSAICPINLFGIGCGLEHEPLHSPYYVFDDEIIDTGVNMFRKIIDLVNENGK